MMTKNTKKRLCLVVPCYNEKSRMDMSAFEKYWEEISFVFVNDGSSDGTLELLKAHSSKSVLVYSLEKNSGKAEAVRQGMLFADSSPELSELEWFGFWDADLATPLHEAENLLAYHDIFRPDADAVFGSRISRLGGKIKRSPARHVIGRIFATIFGLLFKVKSYDSQCGAKIFRRSCVRKAFEEKFLSRWIFDVEIMIRLKDLEIVEFPLSEWTDVGGSKIMKLSNFVIIAKDMFNLWRKYG